MLMLLFQKMNGIQKNYNLTLVKQIIISHGLVSDTPQSAFDHPAIDLVASRNNIIKSVDTNGKNSIDPPPSNYTSV